MFLGGSADVECADDRAEALGSTERGESHAIEDFLYDYYSTRPSLLRRWYPGPGIVLGDAPDHATWKYYRTDAGLTRMDAAAFMAARGLFLGLLYWRADSGAAFARGPA